MLTVDSNVDSNVKGICTFSNAIPTHTKSYRQLMSAKTLHVIQRYLPLKQSCSQSHQHMLTHMRFSPVTTKVSLSPCLFLLSQNIMDALFAVSICPAQSLHELAVKSA